MLVLIKFPPKDGEFWKKWVIKIHFIPDQILMGAELSLFCLLATTLSLLNALSF